MRIEWPPGSGARADYTSDEIEFVQSLFALADSGDVKGAQIAREVEVYHDLKVLLDAKPVE